MPCVFSEVWQHVSLSVQLVCSTRGRCSAVICMWLVPFGLCQYSQTQRYLAAGSGLQGNRGQQGDELGRLGQDIERAGGAMMHHEQQTLGMLWRLVVYCWVRSGQHALVPNGLLQYTRGTCLARRWGIAQQPHHEVCEISPI